MKHIDYIKQNIEEINKIFREELVGASAEVAGYLYNIVNYFEQSTFYTDPASAKYHNAFDGGLADHCLKVYKRLVLFNEISDSCYTNLSLVKVAFLHDLCKVGNYNREVRWRKDDNNKWESYYNYGYNDLELNLGHGAESLVKAQELCYLSKEEAAAIFWHMGVGTTYNIYDFYNQARQSKLVLFLHMADVYSSSIDEKYGFDDSLVFRDIQKLVYGV